MNITSTLGLGILVFLSIFIYVWQQRRLRHRKDLESKIKQGFPLPVELLTGPFRVLEKVGNNIIRVCPIGKNAKKVLVIKVPRRMFMRVEENIVYNFSYNYSDHEIRFDSNSLHTEESDLAEDEMKKRDFPLKVRILKDIIF